MAIKASTLGIIFCGVPSAAVSTGCFLHTKYNGGNGNGASLRRKETAKDPEAVQNESSPEEAEVQNSPQEQSIADATEQESAPKITNPESEPAQEEDAIEETDLDSSNGTSESAPSPITQESSQILSETKAPEVSELKQEEPTKKDSPVEERPTRQIFSFSWEGTKSWISRIL